MCELPTLRATFDEPATQVLREQGYADVLPMIPVVTCTDDDGSRDVDGVAGVNLAESGAVVAPLLADLAKRLESAGWNTAAHFGHDDGIRIPLVVGSPRLRGTWRVAVLLDDEAYIAEPSLRRRERYWVERLENRGWRVFQTFSTSLFIDPEGQTKEVVSILEEVEAAELGSAKVLDGSTEGVAGESGENVSGVPSTGGIADGGAAEVVQEPKPRGPRPHLTPGLPLAAYTDDQLDEVVAWIVSDGLTRSNDELVQCLREELDLHRRGAQVDAVLHNVVRRSAKINASDGEQTNKKSSPATSLLEALEKSDVLFEPSDVGSTLVDDPTTKTVDASDLEDGTEK